MPGPGPAPGFEREYANDAFISYRRLDGRLAAGWLRNRLQAFRLPAGVEGHGNKPLRCYLDTVFRTSMGDYRKAIGDALRSSRYLIVVATPLARRSRRDGSPNGVVEEIHEFLQVENAKDRLIVAVARGNRDDPLPADLHIRLPSADVADLRGRSLFARLFKGADDPEEEILTIVGALHGVTAAQMPLLRREDQRRRRALGLRRWLVGFLVMALLAAALGIALYQLREARHQQIRFHLATATRMLDTAPLEARLHLVKATDAAAGLSWLGLDDRIVRHALGFWGNAFPRPKRARWRPMSLRGRAVAARSNRLAAIASQSTALLIRGGDIERLFAPAPIDSIVLGELATAAFSSDDRRVFVWPDGEPVPRTLPLGTGPVVDVALHPAAPQVAVAFRCELEVWDHATAKQVSVAPVRIPDCRPDDISGRQSLVWIAYGLGGERLVATLGQRRLLVGPGNGNGPFAPIELPASSFFEMDRPRVSASGSLLVVPWGRLAVRVLNLDSAKAHDDSPELSHPAPVSAAVLNHEGTLLATACTDGNVRVWSLGNWKEPQYTFAHPGRVLALAMGSQWLVTGDDAGVVRAFDTSTGRQLGLGWQHRREVHHVAWAGETGRIVSASSDGTLAIHALQERSPDWRHYVVGARDIHRGPTDDEVLIVDREFRLRRVGSRAVGPPIEACSPGRNGQVRFSPRGRYAIRVSAGTLALCDLSSEPPVVSRPTREELRAERSEELQGVAAELLKLAPPEGAVDRQGKKAEQPFPFPVRSPPVGLVTASDFNVARNFAWVLTENNKLAWWDCPVCEKPIERDFSDSSIPVRGVLDLSADRRRIAVSFASAAQVLSSDTLQPTAPAMDHREAVVGAVFLDAGRLLVSATGTGLRLWDVETGLPIGVPIHHHPGIGALIALNQKSVAVLTGTGVFKWSFVPRAAPASKLAAEAREEEHAWMSDRAVVHHDAPPP